MMKKLLFVVLMGLILTSCSKEDEQLDNKTDFSLSVITDTDAISTEVYKGTYAALGSDRRGMVSITLTDDSAVAKIVFVDGTETTLSGTGSISSHTGARSYGFTSATDSFNFSITADGSPVVSSVDIADADGSIVLMKDTDATPVRLSTGVFGCDDCGDHPILSDPNMQSSFIWNAIFTEDGISSGTVLIQVSFGATWFRSVGSIDDPYDKVGTLIYNDLEGSFPFGTEGLIQWDATQMYDMTGVCLDVIGNWNLENPSYNIDGWIRADDMCNPL